MDAFGKCLIHRFWIGNPSSARLIAVNSCFAYAGGVHCIVTAGPTYEPLDQVRRLTNFSTGRLGSDLARYLVRQGHSATLLLGEQATYRDPNPTYSVEPFTTTADLRRVLQAKKGQSVGAVFHAAAVSDFTFGQVWLRAANGDLSPVKSGKISTRAGTLLAELLPTSKIISELRGWFSTALIVGWKFEVEGDRAGALALGEKQIQECHTNACVVNGPAYGTGFGVVTPGGNCTDLPDTAALFERLQALLECRA